MNLKKELEEIAKVSNGFKPIKILATKIAENHTQEELENMAHKLYESEIYQVRMLAVFLFGKISATNAKVLSFLKSEVSKDENWRVQEILAMAFDNYCKDTGYENALETIEDWLVYHHPNTRRAVSEGLRIWTSRPFFQKNPDVAIRFLSQLRNDDSEYVRKSCGNALRDISKKYPEKVFSEISNWKSDNKKVNQIKKLIRISEV